MKIFVLVSIVLVVLINNQILGYTVSNNVMHVQAKHPWSNGIWQKKMIWKPRWVKSWQERKYYVATWKKVWGPVEINEWVPLPKPPPGWSKISRN